jgi:2-polyprenyl-3-methyl-5-hydroxy-6-metoxy-1,4-benzoquinol methylase
MLLEATDKQQIRFYLQAALSQMEMINKISLDVSDLFEIINLSLEDENNITNMFVDDNWPQSIPQSQIGITEADKIVRAENIIYLFLNDEVVGQKILDFGTGQGQVPATIAKKGAKLSVGYDIVQDGWTTELPNLIYTTDFSLVVNNAPYDSILLYDVLDHTSDPVEALKQVSSVLAEGGKIHLRCHPWCSRHGGHVFRSINKAYAHLFLSEKALQKLSLGQAPIQRIIHPQRTYSEWFDAAGLKVYSRDIVQEDVEPFFMGDKTKNFLISLYHNSPIQEYADGIFPSYPMAQQFLDYSIGKQ